MDQKYGNAEYIDENHVLLCKMVINGHNSNYLGSLLIESLSFAVYLPYNVGV